MGSSNVVSFLLPKHVRLNIRPGMKNHHLPTMDSLLRYLKRKKNNASAPLPCPASSSLSPSQAYASSCTTLSEVSTLRGQDAPSTIVAESARSSPIPSDSDGPTLIGSPYMESIPSPPFSTPATPDADASSKLKEHIPLILGAADFGLGLLSCVTAFPPLQSAASGLQYLIAHYKASN